MPLPDIKNIEPLRLNRFLLYFPEEFNISSYLVKAVELPNFTIDEESLKPAFHVEEDGSIKNVRQLKYKHSDVVVEIYNTEEFLFYKNFGYPANSFKFDLKLDILNGLGDVIHTMCFKHAYISVVENVLLNYETPEKKEDSIIITKLSIGFNHIEFSKV